MHLKQHILSSTPNPFLLSHFWSLTLLFYSSPFSFPSCHLFSLHLPHTYKSMIGEIGREILDDTIFLILLSQKS